MHFIGQVHRLFFLFRESCSIVVIVRELFFRSRRGAYSVVPGDFFVRGERSFFIGSSAFGGPFPKSWLISIVIGEFSFRGR